MSRCEVSAWRGRAWAWLLLAAAACEQGDTTPAGDIRAPQPRAQVGAAQGGRLSSAGAAASVGGAGQAPPAGATAAGAMAAAGNGGSSRNQPGAGMSGASGAAAVSGTAGGSSVDASRVAAAGANVVTAGASGVSAGAGASSAGAPGSGTPTGTPSEGCSKQSGRPQDGVIKQSDRIYNFPVAYDGKTPMPLLLALHAAGNPNTQLQNLTKGSRLETEFVRAFPKSAGNAWVYNTDRAKVMAVLDELLANYCIDTSRIFATGHSSGAQMVVQMLCNGDKHFKAVAPVAASKYCAKLSPVAVMYIQGMMDAQRGGGNGMDVVDVFTTSNGCDKSSSPKTDVPSCSSSFDRKPVIPGCVTYQGCMVPSVWCSHDDNGYNNTDGRQHGWPCFASDAIADFFLSLP